MSGEGEKPAPPALDPPWRNFYGRRHGKRLKPSQRAHLERLLPLLRVPGAGRAENPGRLPVDLAALFGRPGPVWLEIGFGAGEHLAAQARAHPHIGMIGCEPFVNGVATLLGRLAAAVPGADPGADRGNVRLHPGDARDLLDVLPPASLARVFLLYPDPWPKSRHRRRRFVSAENLAALARVMAPGAELRLATDIADYAGHAATALAASGFFAPIAAAPPGWHRPWPGWQGTRYEAKALREGRAPHYLTLRREAAAGLPVDRAGRRA
ncbi:tRNA (guanine(46)-N(7))-methyltransferase TrmB [soil metagenome]